jgi:hypothetical protein
VYSLEQLFFVYDDNCVTELVCSKKSFCPVLGNCPVRILLSITATKLPATESCFNTVQSRSHFHALLYVYNICGLPGGAVAWGIALQAGRSRVRFPIESLIFPAALWPWSRLNLQQKWVPGIFPRGKRGRCLGVTNLSPSRADCLEIWEPQLPGIRAAYPGLYRVTLPLSIAFSYIFWSCVMPIHSAYLIS